MRCNKLYRYSITSLARARIDLRDIEMQMFCRVAIDDQFECRRLLHR